MSTFIPTRPVFRLATKFRHPRNVPLVPFAAAWKAPFPDTFNVKLQPGWKLVSPEGVTYSGENAYFNLYQNEDAGLPSSESRFEAARRKSQIYEDLPPWSAYEEEGE